MKKKKIILFILVALSIGFLFSCNNNKPANGNGESTVTPPVTDTTHPSMQTVASANSFCTLKIDSADLASLLDKDTKKLIVQLTYDGTGNCMNLVAYGAKTNNVKTTGPAGLVALANSPTTFNGPVILGDQELTLKSIKTVLGLPHSSGKIDPAKLKSLQFVPLKDGNNHIYYAVTKLGMSEADGSALTNPSPPAPPCENGCDY